MPSTYTDRLGFEKQGTGENLSIWGERLNNALELIDEAIAGIATISLTGNRTLTNTINTVNEARKAILVFTDGGLSAIPVVTIPPEQKSYYVENRGATYPITITAGGTTASVPVGRKVFVLCDGAAVTAFDPVALTDAARMAAQSAQSGAETARDAALVSQVAAAASAAAALASQIAAAASQTAAAGSATSAGTSATNAASSASAASGSQTAAAGSATAAATSATNAGTSATNAGTSATNAGNSATSASGSATTATTKAGEASASATLAQQWAANSENVIVTGSLYSALHYAAKAAASATAAAMFDPSSYVPKAGNVSLTGNIYDTVVDKGTVSSGTVTFSVAAGSRQRLQVGGALTIALSNKPTTAWGIEIELVNGGAAVITWPVVSWSKGDGTYSTTFSDMGVALLASGTNTVILWANAAGTVFGKAG